jgi:hypothetical protein
MTRRSRAAACYQAGRTGGSSPLAPDRTRSRSRRTGHRSSPGPAAGHAARVRGDAATGKAGHDRDRAAAISRMPMPDRAAKRQWPTCLRKFMGLTSSQAVPGHCHDPSGQRFANAHKHTLTVSVRRFANSRQHIPGVNAGQPLAPGKRHPHSAAGTRRPPYGAAGVRANGYLGAACLSRRVSARVRIPGWRPRTAQPRSRGCARGR